MNLKNIPTELQALRQWVCATNQSKAPMQATRRAAASSTNPGTWASFHEAVNAVADNFYDYIGFVFNDNGYVGIDIDDGYEDGLISPLAVDIISHCKSYTEHSKSGRGFHIILKGDLPFKGKNNMAGVEIYKTGRYFITTGEVLLYSEIIENQNAIDYVIEKYFPGAKEAASEGRFEEKIYQPIWGIENGIIPLFPQYPEVPEGGRNTSLASLAGSLHSAGYSKAEILKELYRANSAACKPPLKRSEVSAICSSILKYQR